MADMLMSEMINTISEARALIGSYVPMRECKETLDQLDKVLTCLDEKDVPHPESAASIRWAGFNELGMAMGHGTRSSDDPIRDMSLMTGFLEFNDAWSRRGVPVRFKLGSLWVTSEVPPANLRIERLKDGIAAMHAAVKYAIDLAEANGKVLRVYSKPNPFELRMGGHYMAYELRDNLATARRKAKEPCKIVSGSNYDEELFFETFYADGEVFERDNARILCKSLNDDPKRDDRIYWKVVDADYTLYKFEP